MKYINKTQMTDYQIECFYKNLAQGIYNEKIKAPENLIDVITSENQEVINKAYELLDLGFNELKNLDLPKIKEFIKMNIEKDLK